MPYELERRLHRGQLHRGGAGLWLAGCAGRGDAPWLDAAGHAVEIEAQSLKFQIILSCFLNC